MKTVIEAANAQIEIRNPGEGIDVRITKDGQEMALFINDSDEALKFIWALTGYAGHCCAGASDEWIGKTAKSVSIANELLQQRLLLSLR